MHPFPIHRRIRLRIHHPVRLEQMLNVG